MSAADLPLWLQAILACPACRGDLAFAAEAIVCRACRRRYPVLHGIADFRLAGDRYLSLAEERAKAARLAASPAASLDRLVEEYYRMTDDVPPALRPRYLAYIRSGPERARPACTMLAPSIGDGIVLDAGCGTAGLALVLARAGHRVVAMDVALRWLVIAKRRLDEAGLAVPLLAGDVESPPFRPECFTAIGGIDLIEHVRQPAGALGALSSLLRPGGRLWLSAINARSPGPHPSTGIWAAGWWPDGVRRALVRSLRGVDSLRAVHLLHPGACRRLADRAGLRAVDVRPRQVPAAAGSCRGALERGLLRLYRALLVRPAFQSLLVLGGPAFEMTFEKPMAGHPGP